MSNLFSHLSLGFTAIISTFGILMGGYDRLLHALLLMIVIDYVLGVISAIYNKNLNSEIGFRGLLKKVALILIVAVAVECNRIIPNVPIREIVISFYLANEGLSILENTGKIIPIPEKLKQIFEQLREKKTDE